MNAQSSRREAILVLRAGMACAAFAVAAGCVSSGVYPDAWAAKVEAGAAGCPTIDGEYVNEGEYFEKVDDDGLKRHTTTFGQLAACMECSIGEPAEGAGATAVTETYLTFRLQLVDDVLKISATAADGATHGYEQKIRKRCADSMMLIEAEWWSSLEEEEGQEMFGATLGMSVLMRGSWKLGRAEDGSLLVQQTAAGSLLVFYWPILPMSFKEWVRFPPVAPEPAQHSALAP
ncbi:MAG: hypothetical protein ACT4UP_09215 [Gammaproteobacteria bacterium]